VGHYMAKPMANVLEVSRIGSGGNSLFPVGGGQSLPNFRQNFQISDNPPPPFALEKAVFSLLLGKKFRKFVIFREGGGGGGCPPPHQDFRHCALNLTYIKLSGTACIIVPKTPSKFAPCEFKLRFKLYVFACKPFPKWSV
jgi:hypothetical protein